MHLILSQIENSFARQQIAGRLAILNAKETVIRDMQRNGFLNSICHSYMIDLKKKQMWRYNE